MFLIFPKLQQAQKELWQQPTNFQADHALEKLVSSIQHRAEAGTGGCSGKAPEGAEMIHTQAKASLF